jgi:flagellar protein FliS
MEEAMTGASANAYRKVQVTTASPAQLVVQLFEGAARFIEQGIQAIERRDLEQAHTALVRAQAIIAQLRASLDREVGPLADQLDGLYDYFFRRLVLANVEKDAAPAREVLGHIRELLAAWREVARQGLTGPEPVPVDVRA